MAFVALTPHTPGPRITRWTSEERSVFPVIAGGCSANIALWLMSRRHVLLFLAAVNTASLLAARHFSGIAVPSRAAFSVDDEERKYNSSSVSNKRMSEAKKERLKKLEADRMLLATCTSFVCGAWAVQGAMHCGRVFMAQGESAVLWRSTSSAQLGVAVALALAMGYKGYVEGQIAYAHRWD